MDAQRSSRSLGWIDQINFEFPGLYWSGISDSTLVRPWFDVAVKPEREVIRLEAAGQLDLAAAPCLRNEVDELIRSGFLNVVLDLRRLTFIDIAGVRLLHQLTADAQKAGWQLAVLHDGTAIRRLLDLCGELGVLPLSSQGSTPLPG